MENKKDINRFDFLKHLQIQALENTSLPYFIANKESFEKIGRTLPFKNYFYTIGLFYNGDGAIKIGSKEYKITDGSLLTIGPGVTCQWMSESYPLNDTLLFYEEVFLNSFSSTFFYSLEFFCPDVDNVMQLSGTELEEMKYLFKALKLLKDKPEAIAGILFSILQITQKKYWALYKGNKKKLSVKERTVAKFRSLVSKNFSKHKDVSFYADRLNITPKYMSEILVELTGLSAKKWIDYHLMQEAKYLLSYVGLSVKEVGLRLGFADTSHFVKAFKKHEGHLPSFFRQMSNDLLID